jgi:hypothetical protein
MSSNIEIREAIEKLDSGWQMLYRNIYHIGERVRHAVSRAY